MHNQILPLHSDDQILPLCFALTFFTPSLITTLQLFNPIALIGAARAAAEEQFSKASILAQKPTAARRREREIDWRGRARTELRRKNRQ